MTSAMILINENKIDLTGRGKGNRGERDNRNLRVKGSGRWGKLLGVQNGVRARTHGD